MKFNTEDPQATQSERNDYGGEEDEKLTENDETLGAMNVDDEEDMDLDKSE